MTDYQKSWNSEIENLLHELGNPPGLYENIVNILANSGWIGIYENQIINALRLGISIKENNRNIALVSPMQSGKSNTIYFLCNYVLPAIGFLKDRETVLFVTSMRDTDLYDQNKDTLEKDFYDVNEKRSQFSRIKVLKMSDFFNHPNPHKIVKDYKVNLVVRDEDQYGCGEESSFQFAFFDELRQRLPNIALLSVSATPYDILDAHIRKRADIDVVEGVRPPSYYGISEMLEDNIIEDLPVDFKPLQNNGKDEKIIHPKVEQYIEYLEKFENGLGIIRESKTLRAIELRNLIRKKYGSKSEVIAIGSDSTCDFGINEGLKEVSNLILRRGKRVILIVVQALTAGKDLGMLKEKIRFGIETRDKQLANGSQGITGRCCGYHTNRGFKLLASVPLLEHYAQFEQDWEIFGDDNWRDELFNQAVKGLTTQTSFSIEQQSGIFTEIQDIYTVPYTDLISQKGRDRLDFLDEKSYRKLLSFFEEEFYNNRSKGIRLNSKNVTMRLASGYKLADNRVYKNWDATKDRDFGNIFFKKEIYEYGLLIINYPEDHPNNIEGFCGVKVFKAGKTEMRERKMNIINGSMYN